MPKVKITCDSACDLSPQLCERYHISVIPMYVALGDRLCRDGVDVKPGALFAYAEEWGRLPAMAAASAEEYADFFRPFVEEGCEVVHISLSAELSSGYRNACLGAQTVGNVYAVNSRSISAGSGHLVILAAELASADYDGAYIAGALDEMKGNLDVSFLLHRPVCLHKTGLHTGLIRLAAGLLKLRPEIVMEDGMLRVGKMHRGSLENTVLDYVRGRLEKEVNYGRIFVTHSGVPREIVDKVIALVKELRPFEEVIETVAGSTISCHCGPECLGVLFFRK